MPHIVPLRVGGVPSGAAAKTTAYPAADFGDRADLPEGRFPDPRPHKYGMDCPSEWEW